MRLYELLYQSTNSAISLLNSETGAMPAGHNGPYFDPETPVRNTAHWLLTFLKVYQISGQKKFKEAAQHAAHYLTSDVARPMRATFWHRKNPKKDTCNGLIGQAWTLEALTIAAKALEIPKLASLAEEVFLLHPFDEQVCLWQRVSVDGSYLPFDLTFNHQLWFAAVGSLLSPYASSNDVADRVNAFMNQLLSHLTIYSSGLIQHPLTLEHSWRYRAKNLLSRLQQSKHTKDYLKVKAIGYHAFNLYAFALLKSKYPDHAFWDSSKFKYVWRYAQSENYKFSLAENPYGYPYNPPGFEMPFALATFGKDNQADQQWWLSEQIKRCYNFDTHSMSLATQDPVTHAARLYEATRLPDLEIPLE